MKKNSNLKDMSENFNLIKFKYEHGAYEIQELIKLVPYFITAEQFFDITGLKYQIIKKQGVTSY